MKLKQHFQVFIVSLFVFQATSQYMLVLEQDASQSYNPYATSLYNILLSTTSFSLALAMNSALTMYLTVEKQANSRV